MGVIRADCRYVHQPAGTDSHRYTFYFPEKIATALWGVAFFPFYASVLTPHSQFIPEQPGHILLLVGHFSPPQPRGEHR